MANDPYEYGPTGHTRASSATGQIEQLTYIYDALGNLKSWTWLPIAAPATVLASPVVSTSTGVNPTETSYSLYGHNVPLSVLGLARIGGEIIGGPWVENGKATFCISFGVPADPNGTRTLREIAFDSEVVWTAADGFSAEGFTYRWYPGTLTQAADPIEIAHYGADAIAYRPQMLLWFENLPLANTKFKKIPYVAALIADSVGDMINFGEGFDRLAWSPWVNYTSAQFETIGVTDTCHGMIFAADADFLSTIQQFGRFYQNWDILQTDKLRIIDRGAKVTADINLNRSRMSDQVVLSRAARDSVPRELELSTIDPDADYTIVPSKAVFPRVPVAVSSSVSTETVFLPMIMDAHTRQSLVTYALYQQEVARKRVAVTAMLYGLEIEPGDLVALLDLGDDFVNEVFKIVETTHGINYAVELTLESILRCSLVADDLTDPDFSYVVLLLGFNGINGSVGAPGFTDESLRHQGIATVSGGPQIATAQFKFGISSVLISGSLPQVQFSSNSDFNLSNSNSDEFTIECWARFNSFLIGYNSLISKAFSQVEWRLAAFSTAGGSTGALLFQSAAVAGTFNVDLRTAETALTTGIWYHLAVDKDSTGKIRIYKNGTVVGSVIPVNSSISYDPINFISMGSIGFGGGKIDGYIDEVRITRKARYKTDAGFTPPAAPFPRGGPL